MKGRGSPERGCVTISAILKDCLTFLSPRLNLYFSIIVTHSIRYYDGNSKLDLSGIFSRTSATDDYAKDGGTGAV